MKEAAEDIKRHTADFQTNNKKLVTVCTSAGEANIPWRNLAVGQIVRLTDRAEVS